MQADELNKQLAELQNSAGTKTKDTAVINFVLPNYKKFML
jgi:hypothetical protein